MKDQEKKFTKPEIKQVSKNEVFMHPKEKKDTNKEKPKDK